MVNFLLRKIEIAPFRFPRKFSLKGNWPYDILWYPMSQSHILSRAAIRWGKSLHETCPSTEFFLVRISCIQSKYRKLRTRKNFVFGHFSRSEIGLRIKNKVTSLTRTSNNSRVTSVLSNKISLYRFNTQSKDDSCFVRNKEPFEFQNKIFHFKGLTTLQGFGWISFCREIIYQYLQ